MEIVLVMVMEVVVRFVGVTRLNHSDSRDLIFTAYR